MTRDEVINELLQIILGKIDNEYRIIGNEIIAARQSLKDPEHQILRFLGSLGSLPARLEEMKKMAENALALAKMDKRVRNAGRI
jgi:hypothetical protein